MQIQTFYILKDLLWRDILEHHKYLTQRLLDALVWSTCVTFLSQYILPTMGMPTQYGAFMLVGNFALWGLFETNTQVVELLTEKSLSYFLTLPIKPTWFFIKQGFANAYKSWAPSFAILPPGLLMIHSTFNWTHLSIPLFIFMHLLAVICFGFFTLFLTSFTHNVKYISSIRQRIIFPIWFLGCTQFSWATLYKTMPWVAYCMLANPVTYIMEGIRAAVFGQDGFLPLPVCMLMIVLYTLLFGYIGITRLLKRFDCI
ncbi:ABC transporter permease [bacterium]|nr:ABC transporter permease [bacterium]NBX78553.1 ABC transporter permease [bacterium]